jgi:non-ribosomal peptide synthetase component F
VGANSANRVPLEAEGLIGCFINQIVLRADLSGNPTFRELLARVRRTALDAYGHELLSFDRLVEELNPPREAGRHLLFQVKFELQARQGPRELAGLVLEQVETGHQILRYDLYLVLRESPEGITGSLDYNADLFEPGTVARMARQLEALVESVAGSADATLADLRAVLAEAERQWRDQEAEDLEQAARHRLGRTRRRAVEAVHPTSTKGVEHVRTRSY